MNDDENFIEQPASLPNAIKSVQLANDSLYEPLENFRLYTPQEMEIRAHNFYEGILNRPGNRGGWLV
jgi:iodotyrosine deiodinase